MRNFILPSSIQYPVRVEVEVIRYGLTKGFINTVGRAGSRKILSRVTRCRSGWDGRLKNKNGKTTHTSQSHQTVKRLMITLRCTKERKYPVSTSENIFCKNIENGSKKDNLTNRNNSYVSVIKI